MNGRKIDLWHQQCDPRQHCMFNCCFLRGLVGGKANARKKDMQQVPVLRHVCAVRFTYKSTYAENVPGLCEGENANSMTGIKYHGNDDRLCPTISRMPSTSFYVLLYVRHQKMTKKKTMREPKHQIFSYQWRTVPSIRHFSNWASFCRNANC